jgi:hypothetical protein
MTSITSFRLMLAFTLISLSPCPNVQAQAPGLMGRDIKSSARMPLLMPDDFSDLHLVA